MPSPPARSLEVFSFQCLKSGGGLVTKSCPTLCDPMNCSPPGFSVRGILQARIMEWVAIFFSRESSWPRHQVFISCISWLGRQILYHWATMEACLKSLVNVKYRNMDVCTKNSDGKDSLLRCTVIVWGSPKIIPSVGSPHQYSSLEYPMDLGVWRAMVHGVAKSWTWLKQLSIASLPKFRIIGDISRWILWWNSK